MTTEYPPISVIVAVRNGERYLRTALESVLQQTYCPQEIIVVDGQSSDRTAEIAKSFDGIRYLYQQNTGIANAYNAGIAAVHGELVAFLSHDDIWTKDKLSIQAQYMTEHPEVQYTIAWVKFFMDEHSVLPPGFRPELLEENHIGRIVETLVARKSVFQKIGLFNPDFTISEDVDWFARASDQNIPMTILPHLLLHKRIHDTNSSLNPEIQNRDLLRALRESIHRKQSKT